MLNKGDIIEECLVFLGETSYYNDNTSDIYRISGILLNSLIENIAADPILLFNAKTVKIPMSTMGEAADGRNRFLLPVDFMGLITANADVTIEQNFLLAEENEVVIQYLAKIPFGDFPVYTKDLMVYGLAKKMALANEAFMGRYELFSQLYEEEKFKVQRMAGMHNFLLRED